MTNFLKWLGSTIGPQSIISRVFGSNGVKSWFTQSEDGNDRFSLDGFLERFQNWLDAPFEQINGLVDSFVNSTFSSGRTQQQIEQDEYTAMREDTSFQRKVADMQASGLNPALMYQSGATSPSVNTAASGSGSGGLSDILQFALLPLEIQKLKAETKDIEAGAEQKRSQTRGQDIDNAWKDIINKTAVDAKRASTELSRSRVREIDQMINESEVRIGKLISETSEVDARKELEISQMLLNQANANRIAELLEFEKLEFEARTSAERAAASHSMANAAYQNGLITNGMIQAICKKEGAEAVTAEVQAAIADPNFNSEGDSQADKVCRIIVSGVNRTVRMLRGK